LRKVSILAAIPIIAYVSFGVYGIYLSNTTIRQHFLIVNTWNDFPGENATDVEAMPAQALQAYFVLKSKGCQDNQIDLMLYHCNEDSVDIDGNGTNDLPRASIDAENDVVNKGNLEAAIKRLGNIAGQYDEVTIYIIAHGQIVGGGSSAFSFENSNLVTSEEFNRWLNGINCKRLMIFLDFCYSGNFAKSLERPGRLIVSASEDVQEAWFYWDWARSLNDTNTAIFGNSGSAFFHPFWKKLDEGESIEQAFEYGKQECYRWGFIDGKSKNVTQAQNPQMYFKEMDPLEKFIFFFPGGPSTWLVATVLLAFIETAIIVAALTSIRTRG